MRDTYNTLQLLRGVRLTPSHVEANLALSLNSSSTLGAPSWDDIGTINDQGIPQVS